MTEILSSAVTIQVVVHFIQTVLSMIVMYWWFDNPLKGNIITLCSLMMLTGVFGMFFGNYSPPNYLLILNYTQLVSK